VARELIREAVGEVFSTYLGAADLKQVVRFFEEGGSLRIREGSPSADVLAQLRRVPEVLENLQPLGVEPGASLSLQAAAGEFVLEGLWAQKKIGRSDDRGFVAPERRGEMEVDLERLERLRRLKKQVN
jgi:magnesium chelatase subunit I